MVGEFRSVGCSASKTDYQVDRRFVDWAINGKEIYEITFYTAERSSAKFKEIDLPVL